jgi:toxin ParE1/3/4
MIAEGPPWTVRLTAIAEADYQNIIDWTLRQFGDLQARIYADTVSAALVALAEGPTTVGARERSEIGRGLFTLHVARGGQKGRHFVLFRVGPDKRRREVEVLRLLHDAMDLRLHTAST